MPDVYYAGAGRFFGVPVAFSVTLFGASLIVKYRFAEEKWYSRFTKAAKENYLEMGLLTFSVVFYTRKNGQLAVDMWVDYVPIYNRLHDNFLHSHENIAEHLGNTCKSFKQMHESKATEIMRSVHEYIKTVKAGARTGAGAGSGPGFRNNDITIEFNQDGHPIVPTPPSWDKITKIELEKLYRTYLAIQYGKTNLAGKATFLCIIYCRPCIRQQISAGSICSDGEKTIRFCFKQISSTWPSS